MKIAMRRFSRSGIIALLTVIAFLTSLGICPRTFPAAETGVNAGEPAETENQSAVSLDVEDQQFRELDEAEENLVAEAIAAVEETRNALQSLEDNNRKAALAALEKTTGKLELLLARRPGLGLMPISASAATYDIVADVRSVKGARAEAEYLLKKGYIQAARRILETLVSEIRITRVNLPLGTYPQAVKTAARLVDEGKLQEAETVLLAALNTLVITEQSIPIPILNTQYLLPVSPRLGRRAAPGRGRGRGGKTGRRTQGQSSRPSRPGPGGTGTGRGTRLRAAGPGVRRPGPAARPDRGRDRRGPGGGRAAG